MALFLQYLGSLNIYYVWIGILIIAIAITLLSVFIKKDFIKIAPVISIITIILALIFIWTKWLGNLAPEHLIVADRFTLVSWLLILISTALIILISIPYLKARDVKISEYYGMILFSIFGMACLTASGNFLTLFIGIEIISITSYVLIGFLRHRDTSNEASIKYFLLSIFASAFLLMGIAFIFGSVGSLDFTIIHERIGDVLSSKGRHFCLFGIGLILTGFAFKIAAVPFHAWAPDVYDGAPTPITIFMATTVKISFFIAFLKIAIMILGTSSDLWINVIWVISVITMCVGNLAAIVQDNIKRMLAYSSIAHTGYMLVVLPAITSDPSGVNNAIMFYLIAYTFMTIAAFAVVIEMGLGKIEHTEINQLKGLGRKRPFLAACFSLSLLSLLGMPPTIGFFAKYYIFLTAIKSGFIWLTIIALFNTVISAFYYLRPIMVMYFSADKEEPEFDLTNPAIVAVLTITIITILYFGIFPKELLLIISKSI